MTAVRLGLQRGWIQFRNIITTPDGIRDTIIWIGIPLGILILTRDNEWPGTSLTTIASTPANATVATDTSASSPSAGWSPSPPSSSRSKRCGSRCSGSRRRCRSAGSALGCARRSCPTRRRRPRSPGRGARSRRWPCFSAWSLAGLLATPGVPRRESGSLMEARRQALMQRLG